MILFEQAVAEGKLDSQSAFLYAQGLYLANGGRYEDFVKLTPDQVQLMLTVHLGDMQRQNLELIKGIYKLFGGEKDI